MEIFPRYRKFSRHPAQLSNTIVTVTSTGGYPMKNLILIGTLLASALAVYSQDAAVTTANTVLRRTPANNGKAIRKLELHSIVHIIRHKGSWAYVKANKSVGWVPANSVSQVKQMRLDRITVLGSEDI